MPKKIRVGDAEREAAEIIGSRLPEATRTKRTKAKPAAQAVALAEWGFADGRQRKQPTQLVEHDDPVSATHVPGALGTTVARTGHSSAEIDLQQQELIETSFHDATDEQYEMLDISSKLRTGIRTFLLGIEPHVTVGQLLSVVGEL